MKREREKGLEKEREARKIGRDETGPGKPIHTALRKRMEAKSHQAGPTLLLHSPSQSTIQDLAS